MTECKGEIGKFALQTMRMISSALDVKVYQKNDTDLEVAARAASCFKAFATFTDGAAIGVDDTLTDEYLGVLSKFAQMATTQHTSEKPDDEEQSRTRLVGLQALSSAAGSEAVFGSNVEFPRQVKIIVPALLTIISEAPLAELKEDSSKKSPVGGDNVSPFFREFAVRKPINDRRAPSLHEHVPGEKGPGSEDVRSAALRCFYDLIGECQASQANTVLDVCFGFLDKTGWSDVERCCWLAERLTAAMLLQSRFVVPTRLVELLVNLPDDSPPTQKHSSVLAMITTILSSNVSLVGLAITDILASLLSVIIRRVGVDSRDALLPALVQCVSSLGTHIYYADQINDIVEEIALQILAVPTTNPAQQETLRVLIYCITGVMKAADLGDQAEARVTSPISEKPGDKGKAPLLETPAIDTRRGLGRRNPIAPEVWQETLPLMCEASYPVRAAYVQAFVFYLETEMPRDRKPRPNEPNITRFCNAVMASIYTLAISSKLGVAEALPTPPDSPHPIEKISDPVEKIADAATSPSKAVSWNVNVIEPTPNGSVASKANPPAINVPVANAAASTTGNSGHTTPVSRKPLRGGRRVSLPLNRLESGANLTSFDNVATPFDYSAILRILDELNNCVPVAALLTAAPMLLALDRDAATELIRRPGDGRTGAWVLERKRACRETVAFAWRRLADRWGVASAVQLADRAINSLPEPFTVPDWRAPLSHDDVLPPPAEPAAFFRDQTEGESQSSSQPIIDPAQLVTAFSTSPSVQATTGRDQASIARRFTSPWNVELAIKECKCCVLARLLLTRSSRAVLIVGARRRTARQRSRNAHGHPERIVSVPWATRVPLSRRGRPARRARRWRR